jgi:hydrogenase maturation factor
VIANDIACMGGTPAWFLATVLLPESCDPSLPSAVFAQLSGACDELGVELVGGHTEVTIGLDRPIVVGAMLGEVERERLVRPESAREGDTVILTKGIAIEGTAVLAREAGERLLAAGVGPAVVDRAAAYLRDPGISVVREAKAACDAAPVRAMHDPTEGGLATALHELALACGRGIRIDQQAITVLPETQAACGAVGLDPMGLLASGALLIVVADADSRRVLRSIEEIGVPARRIGTLGGAPAAVIMMLDGGPAPVRRFDRDELARFLSSPGADGEA